MGSRPLVNHRKVHYKRIKNVLHDLFSLIEQVMVNES